MLAASLSRQGLTFHNIKLSLALNNFLATVLLPVTFYEEAVVMVKVNREELQPSLLELHTVMSCCTLFSKTMLLMEYTRKLGLLSKLTNMKVRLVPERSGLNTVGKLLHPDIDKVVVSKKVCSLAQVLKYEGRQSKDNKKRKCSKGLRLWSVHGVQPRRYLLGIACI